VGGIVDAVASATTEMQSAAQTITATAEQTARQAISVPACANASLG
jgi:hypothetical protein